MTASKLVLLASAFVMTTSCATLDAQARWDRRSPGRMYDIAASRGERDGYDEGLKAGRRNERFNPTGERDYRDADNGYSRSYGSFNAYRDRYRDAFRAGYERGYQDGRRRR